jgi:hypothetical protein
MTITLTGSEQEKLVNILTDTLTEADVKMIADSANGVKLFEEVVGDGKPLNETITALIEFLNKRGDLDKFLEGVYVRRLKRQDVRNAIELLVPGVAGKEAGPAEEKTDSAPSVTVTLMADVPAVDMKEVTDRFEDFEEFALLLRPYSSVYRAARKMCGTATMSMATMRTGSSDPNVLIMLAENLSALQDDLDSFVHELESVPASVRVPAGGLIDLINDNLKLCSAAMAKSEYETIKSALGTIRSKLSEAKGTYNGDLSRAARNMPLDNVMPLLGSVRINAEETAKKFGKVCLELKETGPKVKGKVDDHSKWQSIENSLSFMEDAIHRSGGISTYLPIWEEMKATLAQIAESDEVKKSESDIKKVMADFDETLAVSDIQQGAVAQKFSQVKMLAGRTFGSVGINLKKMCEDFEGRVVSTREILKDIGHAK